MAFLRRQQQQQQRHQQQQHHHRRQQQNDGTSSCNDNDNEEQCSSSHQPAIMTTTTSFSAHHHHHHQRHDGAAESNNHNGLFRNNTVDENSSSASSSSASGGGSRYYCHGRTNMSIRKQQQQQVPKSPCCCRQLRNPIIRILERWWPIIPSTTQRSSCRSSNRRQHRRLFATTTTMMMMVCLFGFFVMLVLLPLRRVAIDLQRNLQRHQQQYVIMMANMNAPDCTYNDLWRSFRGQDDGERRRKKQRAFDEEEDHNKNREECWSLQENVLRVPYTAIVNRNELVSLGHGHMGGVHRALLRLNNSMDTTGSGSRSRSSSRSEDENESYSYCYAALKTDHCHLPLSQSSSSSSNKKSWWTIGNYYGIGGEEIQFDNVHTSLTGVPCVADMAHLINPDSFLRGDITAALLLHLHQRNDQTQNNNNNDNDSMTSSSHHQHNNHTTRNLDSMLPNPPPPATETETDGLLPAWAIVHRPDLPRTFPMSEMRGNPYPDETVVGVIMPLQRRLVPLSTFIVKNSTSTSSSSNHSTNTSSSMTTTPTSPLLPASFRWTAARVAQIFLPAARGLAFLHTLGLAHQDVRAKNVGLLMDPQSQRQQHPKPSSSLLYDYSVLSKLGPCTATTTTTTRSGAGPQCVYCEDESQLSRFEYMEHRKRDLDAFGSDVVGLAEILADLLLPMSHDDDNDDDDDRLRAALLECVEATELVRVLEAAYSTQRND